MRESTEKLNTGGKPMQGIGGRVAVNQSMALYDTMPADLRKIIQNMPLNCHITEQALDYPPNDIESLLETLCAESTAATYGPDHPQAHRYTPIRAQKVY